MNTPLTFLISWAFNLGDGQLLNAPRGADSARFDIVAQPPPGPLGPGELQMMLRTLLARRFGLVAHSELRKVLSRQLAAPVEDGTRITGSFDFTLEWQPDGAPAGDVTRPSLFTALREQLGLRLDVRRTQVEVMVIDRLNLTAVTD